MRSLRTRFAHRAEFIFVYVWICIFRAIGPIKASNLGGRLARIVGPIIPTSKTAHRNLREAMPELSRQQRRRIVAECWENLGRMIGELVHVSALQETPSGPGFHITGVEHLDQVASLGGPCLFFTGHISNWEIVPRAALSRGMDLAFMYRAANNPLVDALILKLRDSPAGHKTLMFAKGARGARGAVAHLAAKGNLGMLIDQKMNDGIAVSFFGRPAMTAPALAAFALKFRCPIVPIHVVREGPARLRVICDRPLTLPDTGNREADIATMMTTANQILERWIREAPGSWLWLHRRWPKCDPAKTP